jgi:hypothetical protein
MAVTLSAPESSFLYQLQLPTSTKPAFTLHIIIIILIELDMRSWSDETNEKLLGWMEENRELLRGAALPWMTKVKEAVFANNDDIDVKKIKSKYHNMKASWKAAKKLQEASGFGVKEDDCTSTVNDKIFCSLTTKHQLILFS